MSNNEQADQEFLSDLLRGADAISAFIRELGETHIKPQNVYYLKRSGKYPIARHGRELVASKRQLTRHARKISFVAVA
jgi:hypothetical protein